MRGRLTLDRLGGRGGKGGADKGDEAGNLGELHFCEFLLREKNGCKLIGTWLCDTSTTHRPGKQCLYTRSRRARKAFYSQTTRLTAKKKAPSVPRAGRIYATTKVPLDSFRTPFHNSGRRVASVQVALEQPRGAVACCRRVAGPLQFAARITAFPIDFKACRITPLCQPHSLGLDRV